MPKPHPIAVACSDLHLTLLQPACRADDWMDVQAGYLAQLKKVAADLPIICAGDIFDKWNASPELINFALRHLPSEMICVPGQHDLPNHRIEDMHRSGYGVLIQASKIWDISYTIESTTAFDVDYYGFGWNQPIAPPSDLKPKRLKIAIIHRYCWIEGKEFLGAPAEGHAKKLLKELDGYDVAIFGDNHKSFVHQGSCNIVNCGGFIRRKSDEINYEPSVWIIHSDGSVKRHKLDTSADKFHKVEKEREEAPFDLQTFIKRLEDLGEHGLDFRQMVEDHLKKEDLSDDVKQIIIESLNAKQ